MPIKRAAVVAGVLAMLLLPFGSGAVLAQGGGPATTDSYVIDEEWCFQEPVELFCFDMKGRSLTTTMSDGTFRNVLTLRERVVVTVDGVVVGGYTTNTVDQRPVMPTRSSSCG